jgi:hypothetical protein
MNPNRDTPNDTPRTKDAKKSFAPGTRNFRVEAERDSDEEVDRVVGRLEKLLEEGGLTEAAGRIINRQLHAYRQEARRRRRERGEAGRAPGVGAGR